MVQAEKAALQHQRDRAKARFEIGQGKITDLHEAQARLDAVDSREVAARSSLELRRAGFLETIGAAPEQLSQLAPEFKPRLPEPADLRAWQVRGEDHNSLVKGKQSELGIAGSEIDKYRLKARPTLNLVASYGAKGQSGNLSPLVAPSGDRTGSVGLQLNVPLYAGGGIDSREREAIARRSQAEQRTGGRAARRAPEGAGGLPCRDHRRVADRIDRAGPGVGPQRARSDHVWDATSAPAPGSTCSTHSSGCMRRSWTWSRRASTTCSASCGWRRPPAN